MASMLRRERRSFHETPERGPLVEILLYIYYSCSIRSTMDSGEGVTSGARAGKTTTRRQLLAAGGVLAAGSLSGCVGWAARATTTTGAAPAVHYTSDTARREGSTDDETPAPALTYNIRVGSQPGASDVVHGFSDPISGRRQRSEPGNAWNNRRWTLRDLAPGKYYWSVQAIDAAYAGSRFAPEQSFTVGADADGSVATTTEEETLPTTVALQDAFPNPFDSRTALRVTLTEQDVVSLEVFDALGARVRTLTHGPRLAGEHEIIWDGRSDAGHAVSAGLYFCRMRTAAGESGTVKLIRLR